MLDYIYGPEWGPSVAQREGLRYLRGLDAFIVATPDVLRSIGGRRIGDVIERRSTPGPMRGWAQCIQVWETSDGLPLCVVVHGSGAISRLADLQAGDHALVSFDAFDSPRPHKRVFEPSWPIAAAAIASGCEPACVVKIDGEIEGGRLLVTHPQRTGDEALKDSIVWEVSGAFEVCCHHFALPWHEGQPQCGALRPVRRGDPSPSAERDMTLVVACAAGTRTLRTAERGGSRPAGHPAQESHAVSGTATQAPAPSPIVKPFAPDSEWLGERETGPFFIACGIPASGDTWDFDEDEIGVVPLLVDGFTRAAEAGRAVLSIGMNDRVVAPGQDRGGLPLLLAIGICEGPDDEAEMFGSLRECVAVEIEKGPCLARFDVAQPRPGDEWTLCRTAFESACGALRLEPAVPIPGRSIPVRGQVEVRYVWFTYDGRLEWQARLPTDETIPHEDIVAEAVVFRLL